MVFDMSRVYRNTLFVELSFKYASIKDNNALVSKYVVTRWFQGTMEGA